MVATETDTDASPIEARHEDGIIHVRLEDGTHLAFPVTLTERLKKASPPELAEIELLPFSLHWPLIDEDLSIESLMQLGYGD
jgi:Protein of unknown function (DUF2442)